MTRANHLLIYEVIEVVMEIFLKWLEHVKRYVHSAHINALDDKSFTMVHDI